MAWTPDFSGDWVYPLAKALIRRAPSRRAEDARIPDFPLSAPTKACRRAGVDRPQAPFRPLSHPGRLRDRTSGPTHAKRTILRTQDIPSPT